MMRQLLPDPLSQDGLRQYQLTILGFVLIYGVLHIALFMDGMISHLFFALEVATIIYIYFFPAQYTARPISKLRNQVFFLLGFAGLWAAQHLLLPLQDGVPLFSSTEVLLEQVSKTLRESNGLEVEIKTVVQDHDGKDEAVVVSYTPYANQMATFMGGIGGLSVLIAGYFVVEAVLVLLKYYSYSALEKEKKTDSAAAATPAKAKESKKDN
ncbi:hypothetical protein BGX23_011412 [Mortierella sp. AD031]|nr:hypothetical protein BGX23_011412 [Mortierella sp. AD031]KAG0219525.1 hypothetical protein BGX33_002470 [Mortierella sp. NVP41]